MSILSVENVSHSFGGREILQKTSFKLLNGEHIGLVGANGEGKSTFLNIITGKLMPDTGDIEWCNRVTTGYLDQHLVLERGNTIRDILKTAFSPMYALEQEMLSIYDNMADVEEGELAKMLEDVGDIQNHLEHSGFYILDSKIEEVANGLGLGEIGLDKDVAELSGGQRAKVLLTKLLLENPMILILDEPTNFLDANHIVWLKNYLKNYENAFILVSHDIEFLNDVVNVIYHIEEACLTRYVGNHDNFLKMYELKQAQILKSYEKQQKEIDRLEDFVARNKARVATSNMAKSRQKQLDKMEIITLAQKKIKPIFSFDEARSPGKEVIKTHDLVIGYDEPLTSPLNLVLERGQKIAIKGVNGLGKTTLLKTILGKINPISGSSVLDNYINPGYFEQEDVKQNQNTALAEIWSNFPSMTNAEVRGALAKCGLTTEHITSQMRVLSGGENAKVRLCKLLMIKTNCLILDEPTNHLDTDAKEELKRALTKYKGAILMVCHEPSFYESFVSDVWNLEQWTTKIV